MRLLKFTSAIFSLVAIGCSAEALEVTSIPQVGAHEPILIVEKNVNPQNKLVVYTKVDRAGRFLTDASDPNRPALDFYWLMDGRNYKPINPLIKSEIRRRFASQWDGANRTSRFTIRMNDLKEVNCDIPDPKLEVYTNETENGVMVEAQMNLGPSDGNMRIKITSIYTEGRSFPPAVESVTVKGDEIVNGLSTGKKVIRTYNAAGKGN